MTALRRTVAGEPATRLALREGRGLSYRIEAFVGLGAEVTDVFDKVDLSSALEALRGELEQAWNESRNRHVRFRVTEVTLTVQAVAGRERGASGKLRWWVVEGGAEGKSSSETTQTLVLSLTPLLFDDAGEQGPLDVAGSEREPGG
jgi:hypothetical protein